MELKAQPLPFTASQAYRVLGNPFNGIERLRSDSSWTLMATKLNPFNGIERLHIGVRGNLEREKGNPFNGIERDMEGCGS